MQNVASTIIQTSSLHLYIHLFCEKIFIMNELKMCFNLVKWENSKVCMCVCVYIVVSTNFSYSTLYISVTNSILLSTLMVNLMFKFKYVHYECMCVKSVPFATKMMKIFEFIFYTYILMNPHIIMKTYVLQFILHI